MNGPRNERIRLRFAKFGRVRFTSHRDLARVWERSLRRSRVPVAYSEGFSPRPRLHFGLALATGHESCGEYLDVDLPPGTETDLDDLVIRIAPTLPEGLVVQAAVPVAAGSTSLQEAVVACTWLVEIPGLGEGAVRDRIEAILAEPEVHVARTRKGREVVDDIRPALGTVRVADHDELPGAARWPTTSILVRADLSTQPRACRPSELLAAIDPALLEQRVIRLHQWTIDDGVRLEPVPSEACAPDGTSVLARPSAAPTLARTS